MKKILLLLTTAILFVSCNSDDTCLCPKGHEDYQGHCTCQASDCECPVRLKYNVLDGQMIIDIWSKSDSLTVGDTLYIRGRSDNFFINSLLYGYTSEYIDDTPGSEQLIKLLLPEGNFTVTAHIAEKGTNNSALSIRILPNIVVNKKTV